MDFGSLLHFAKKKYDETKEQQRDGKFYKTKYSPPKKLRRQSTAMSANIQKFLQTLEDEEAEMMREKDQKLRDEKTKNKMTKSAKKSVLDDAKDCKGNVVEHEMGEGQGDDYGFTSKEAEAMYEKYLEKVRDVPDRNSFIPDRRQSMGNITNTKERVKAAINQERQDTASRTLQRRSTIDIRTSSTAGTSSKADTKSRVGRSNTISKTRYDPEAEKREEEKRLADQRNRAKLKRSSKPQPMDFQTLIRLAEKKQHEPVVFDKPVKKKEPERLLCAKEKREMEERQRRKEQRAQEEKMRKIVESKSKVNGRIPKMNNSKSTSSSSGAKPFSSSSGNRKSVSTPKRASNNNKTVAAATVGSKPAAKAERPSVSGSGSVSGSSRKMPLPPSRNPYAAANKKGAVREFPPRDRPAGSGSSVSTGNAKKRKFPEANVKERRSQAATKSAKNNKRRICVDDESEYDTELDDFIENGDCEEDISKHIRNIFGYDKRRYQDQDDDDRGMVSTFAQVQREEFISKKLGRQEDLEDMRTSKGKKVA